MFPFKGFYCTKSFQKPLVLCSKPFGKLKKFPFKGLFPFDGFPFNEYELYMESVPITKKKIFFIFSLNDEYRPIFILNMKLILAAIMQ